MKLQANPSLQSKSRNETISTKTNQSDSTKIDQTILEVKAPSLLFNSVQSLTLLTDYSICKLNYKYTVYQLQTNALSPQLQENAASLKEDSVHAQGGPHYLNVQCIRAVKCRAVEYSECDAVRAEQWVQCNCSKKTKTAAKYVQLLAFFGDWHQNSQHYWTWTACGMHAFRKSPLDATPLDILTV